MTFKTRQQIALELGISTRTLSRLIKKEALDVKSGLLSPKEQRMIFDRLGFYNLLEPFQLKSDLGFRSKSWMPLTGERRMGS